MDHQAVSVGMTKTDNTELKTELIDRWQHKQKQTSKPKTEWVGDLLDKFNYNSKLCVLIGDSKNDFEAAMDNGLEFFGYNNREVEELSTIRLNLIWNIFLPYIHRSLF